MIDAIHEQYEQFLTIIDDQLYGVFVLLCLQFYKLHTLQQISQMKSELEDMDERQRMKNKARLLAQNKKLNTEIRNLEKEITEIVTTRQNQMIKNYEQTNSDLTKQREQITVQEKYIRKLKTKIDFLKSANTKGNAQFIIKEEDDLLLLKKEHQNMIIEKGVVDRFKQDKLKVLDKDKPFEQHKKQIEENLASVKKSNRTMQAQIVELEREARKFHNYIVLNKTLGRDKKQVSELEYQIAKNQHDIKQSQQKCRELEQKWRSQLETLDTELFQLKSKHAKIQSKLNQIQKEHRMWETRKNGLRDEEQIMEFRDRLSKVQMLPESKQFSNIINVNVKTDKKKQKISTSELVKLSKQPTQNTDKKHSEDLELQLDDKKQKNKPESVTDQKAQQKLDNNAKIKQLRKSDKNIIVDPVEANKQINQNKEGNKKNQEKNKQKGKPIQKQKQKSKQKEQGKNQNVVTTKGKETQKNEKQQEIPNSKQKAKQPQIKSTQKIQVLKKQNVKQDKNLKDEGKSQKVGRKQVETSPKSTELLKQKSDPKLSVGKKQEKNASTNTKNNNLQVKSSTASPAKQVEKNEKKSPDIKAKGNKSPKQAAKEQKEKKPTKLLLKSIGVGTS